MNVVTISGPNPGRPTAGHSLYPAQGIGRSRSHGRASDTRNRANRQPSAPAAFSMTLDRIQAPHLRRHPLPASHPVEGRHFGVTND